MARILNVISAVTPMGGTVTKLRALMKSSRHQHYLYHPGYTENQLEIESELPYYASIGVPASYGIHNRKVWKHVQEIHRLVRTHDIDIIHFYFHFENLFAPFIRLLHPKIKMIRSIVGFDKELPFYRRALVGAGLFSVPNYVFISQYIKRLYEDTYPLLKKKHTRIIYNGAVNVVPAITPLKDRKWLVTTSGLCERKNVLVLIEAMNLIRNQYGRKDIKLYILGDGPEREKITNLVDKCHLNNQVVLVGYTNNVPAYLNQCAIYVHPATTEGFGIAVTEAMEMYCPCIVADKGALPELVKDGENGYLVSAYDAKKWAEMILHLWDNQTLRFKQSEESHRRAVEQFSLQAFIDSHDQLYDELINKNKT